MARTPSAALLAVLAENLRRHRHALGISQEELAHRCGLHRTYIGSIERQERNVTLSSLEVLAEALETDVPRLLMQGNAGVRENSE